MLTFTLPWLFASLCDLFIVASLADFSVGVKARNPGEHRPVLRRAQARRQSVQIIEPGTTQSLVTIPIVGNLTTGRWFGNFSIGNSGPLSLLIDTGSSNIVLNPGRYKPGADSQNLGTNFTKIYGEYAHSLEVGGNIAPERSR